MSYVKWIIKKTKKQMWGRDSNSLFVDWLEADLNVSFHSKVRKGWNFSRLNNWRCSAMMIYATTL